MTDTKKPKHDYKYVSLGCSPRESDEGQTWSLRVPMNVKRGEEDYFVVVWPNNEYHPLGEDSYLCGGSCRHNDWSVIGSEREAARFSFTGAAEAAWVEFLQQYPDSPAYYCEVREVNLVKHESKEYEVVLTAITDVRTSVRVTGHSAIEAEEKAVSIVEKRKVIDWDFSYPGISVDIPSISVEDTIETQES